MTKLTPLFKESEVEEQTPVSIECDEVPGTIVKDVQTRWGKGIDFWQRPDGIDEACQRLLLGLLNDEESLQEFEFALVRDLGVGLLELLPHGRCV